MGEYFRVTSIPEYRILRLTFQRQSGSNTELFLFDLILYIPSTIFQLCVKLGLMCLAQGHKAVMPMRLVLN